VGSRLSIQSVTNTICRFNQTQSIFFCITPILPAKLVSIDLNIINDTYTLMINDVKLIEINDKLPQDCRNYTSFILVWCAIITSNLSHAKLSDPRSRNNGAIVLADVQRRLAEINDSRTIENNSFLNQMDNERQQRLTRLNFKFVNSSHLANELWAYLRVLWAITSSTKNHFAFLLLSDRRETWSR